MTGMQVGTLVILSAGAVALYYETKWTIAHHRRVKEGKMAHDREDREDEGLLGSIHLERDTAKQIAIALGKIAFEMATIGPRLDRLAASSERIAIECERIGGEPDAATKGILLDIQEKVSTLVGAQQNVVNETAAKLKTIIDAEKSALDNQQQ